MSHPMLYLAPSINVTTVKTTTTTTTEYAPIPLPALPPPSSPKDPKLYPLLHARLPASLREFPIVFPGGARATFRENAEGRSVVPDPTTTTMIEEETVASGQGWRLLKKDELGPRPEVGLADAIERFGNRKRALSTDHRMDDILIHHHHSMPHQHSPPPPRKKPRAAGATTSAAAPPSPLPSPNGSPPPQLWGTGAQQQQHSSHAPANQAAPPIQPDLSLTALLTLPSLLTHFTALPPALQSHLLLTLLRHSPLPVLRTLHSVLTPTLARDFLTLLPPELTSIVLTYLPYESLFRCARVSKSWRAIIDSDPILWRDLLKSTGVWFGGNSERAFARTLFNRRARLAVQSSLPLPHPYKILFKSRHLTRNRWLANPAPKRITFSAHGTSVVTCLLFSHNRIISASDDHSIHVYSPITGAQTLALDGHDGGVWALAATRDTLVSGSTDRTVRIWDLETGRCTHVFGGHTSTVRCLAIVKPELIDIEMDGGGIRRERWPKRTVIVTGSRDHTLRVWRLPKPGEQEYRCFGADDSQGDPSDEDTNDNPYHLRLLDGHAHAVRALAARGRTLISGSYDCTVRVWDIITGECRWVLSGHTQKVYSVVLDTSRNQACSGSMDSTVRIWSLQTGQCVHVLTGHTSLVGLLGLSPSYLVSAAADSTLRIWDPASGTLLHTLAAHTGAITCFQHDEFKVLSGSDGTLKLWDIRDGVVARDLLTGITGVWQVVFDGRWCVAASNRMDTTFLDVWDFGREGEGDDEWVGEGSVDEESEQGDSDQEYMEDEHERQQRLREESEEEKGVRDYVAGPGSMMEKDVDDDDEDFSIDVDEEDHIIRGPERFEAARSPAPASSISSSQWSVSSASSPPSTALSTASTVSPGTTTLRGATSPSALLRPGAAGASSSSSVATSSSSRTRPSTSAATGDRHRGGNKRS